MNQVVDYQIVLTRRLQDLSKEVKEALNQGWVPSGPVILDEGHYGQVMVKFG